MPILNIFLNIAGLILDIKALFQVLRCRLITLTEYKSLYGTFYGTPRSLKPTNLIIFNKIQFVSAYFFNNHHFTFRGLHRRLSQTLKKDILNFKYPLFNHIFYLFNHFHFSSNHANRWRTKTNVPLCKVPSAR